MKLVLIDDSFIGKRLDRWIKIQYPGIPQSYIEKALRAGSIRVNNKKAKSSYRLEEGDAIALHKEIVPPVSIKGGKLRPLQKYIEELKAILINNIILQDENIIAINKPAGISVQGGSKVKVSIDDVLPELKFDLEYRPRIVHRLDKDTTGVLLIARTPKVAEMLTEKFRNKEISKTYFAFVVGSPAKKKGIIETNLKKVRKGESERMEVLPTGSKAITHYEVVGASNMTSLVKLMPITGKTHQLRVHCSYSGFPVIADGKYGSKEAFIDKKNKNMLLHAREIEFNLMDKEYKITACFLKEFTDFSKQYFPGLNL
jgi:23S rRNA pseudouridine955/2504/2580 synthase